MDMLNRVLLLSAIAGKNAGTGKTAMMKYAYLLQTLYGVPFGYEFEIYTYGPFCQTVMSDLDYAEFLSCVKIQPIQYSNYRGYRIEETETGKVRVSGSDTVSRYGEEIDAALEKFGNKSAKELELYSTIVYVAKSELEGLGEIKQDSVCETVGKIKPHFDSNTIKAAFCDLQRNEMLDRICA